jgi:hypothetical protein
MFAEPAAQRVVPGLQSPVQAPSAHVFMQAACGWFVPLESHRNGVLSGPQLLVPGLQEPVQAVAVPVPVQAYGQIVVSRQMPSKSHCWMTSPFGLHRWSPGVQPAAVDPSARLAPRASAPADASGVVTARAPPSSSERS